MGISYTDEEYERAREQAEEDVEAEEVDGYRCPDCRELFDYGPDLTEHWMLEHSGFDADDNAYTFWVGPDDSEYYQDKEEAIRATLVQRGYELPKDDRRVDDTKKPAPTHEWCNAVREGGHFFCTRYKGHSGDHMTLNQGGSTMDRWEQEAKPDVFPANNSGQSCRNRGSNVGYVCTREQDHSGDHVATMGFYKPSAEVLDRWPNKDAEEDSDKPRFENDRERRCRAESPGGWVCTRTKGHDGDHMAIRPGRDDLYIADSRGSPVWDDLDLRPEPEEEPNSCDAKEKETGYWCTRDEGHEGDHIATYDSHATEEDRDRALAVWHNDALGAYPSAKDEHISSARQESKSLFEAMMEGDEATG